MKEKNLNNDTVGKSWNTYWQGASSAGAFSSGGIEHPDIANFWLNFFKQIENNIAKPKLLDIASGNGAVIKMAINSLNCLEHDITSLDISEAATQNIKSQYPDVQAIVANANELPNKFINSYEVVTSQFGIEYAGFNAVKNALTIVKNDGYIALVLHHRSGTIYRECERNLNSLERVKACEFLPRSIELFKSGFNAIKGHSREPYDAAGLKLSSAIKELELIMREYGEEVADYTIANMYNDVAKIHQRIQFYEPHEVISWLERLKKEIDAYIKRMESMLQSAISESNYEEIINLLKNSSFKIADSGVLAQADNNEPIAWKIIAKKIAKI